MDYGDVEKNSSAAGVWRQSVMQMQQLHSEQKQTSLIGRIRRCETQRTLSAQTEGKQTKCDYSFSARVWSQEMNDVYVHSWFTICMPDL